MLRRLFHRFTGRPSPSDDEIARELQDHLDLDAESLAKSLATAANVAPNGARLAAQRRFGNVAGVSEADARLHVVNAEGFLEPLLATWDPHRSVMRRTEFPRVYKPFNLSVFRHSGWVERGSALMGRRIKPIAGPPTSPQTGAERPRFTVSRPV